MTKKKKLKNIKLNVIAEDLVPTNMFEVIIKNIKNEKMTFDNIRLYYSSFRFEDNKIELDVFCPEESSNLFREINYLTNNEYFKSIYITVDFYNRTGETKAFSYTFKCNNFSANFDSTVCVNAPLVITIKADADFVENYYNKKSMTKKEYAKELKKLVKAVTAMHSREFYREYAKSENAYDELFDLLNKMENDND